MSLVHQQHAKSAFTDAASDGVGQLFVKDHAVIHIAQFVFFAFEFELPDKKIKKARLYATARGIYECRVNGNKVTDLEAVVSKANALYNEYSVIKRGKKKYSLIHHN